MTEYPRLVAAVTLVADSHAVAEECVQEALARAWERSGRGEEIRSLPAWIATVALNLARSSLRRLAAERRSHRAMSVSAPPPGEDAIEVQRALRQLPRRQREVTVLRYWLDMEITQIARTLRVSEGTVKTSLFRARGTLERLLGASHEAKEGAHVDDR